MPETATDTDDHDAGSGREHSHMGGRPARCRADADQIGEVEPLELRGEQVVGDENGVRLDRRHAGRA